MYLFTSQPSKCVTQQTYVYIVTYTAQCWFSLTPYFWYRLWFHFPIPYKSVILWTHMHCQCHKLFSKIHLEIRSVWAIYSLILCKTFLATGSWSHCLRPCPFKKILVLCPLRQNQVNFLQYMYRTYAMHSRNKFSNFSLFCVTLSLKFVLLKLER